MNGVQTSRPLRIVLSEESAYILAGSFVGFLIQSYGLADSGTSMNPERTRPPTENLLRCWKTNGVRRCCEAPDILRRGRHT